MESGAGLTLTVILGVRIAITLLSLALYRSPRTQLVAFAGSTVASIATMATGVAVLRLGSVPTGTIFWHRASEFSLTYKLDGLSAWFLIVLSTLAIPIAVFSLAYVTHGPLPRRSAFIAAMYNVLVGAVELVFVAGDAVTFLFGWDLMTLTAAALLATEHEERTNRGAAYLYLVMSHIGTGCLIARFLILAAGAGSLSFSTLLAARVVRGPMR